MAPGTGAEAVSFEPVEPTLLVIIAADDAAGVGGIDRWRPTLRCLAMAAPITPLSIAIVGQNLSADDLVHLVWDEASAVTVTVHCVAAADGVTAAINRLIDEHVDQQSGPVAICTEPVLLSADSFPPALQLISGDVRVSAVSPWCNFASYLSFPHRNAPSSHQMGLPLDEAEITGRLRAGPAVPAAPIPVIPGPLTIIGGAAWLAVGPLDVAPAGGLVTSLIDWGLRSQRRGLQCLLDSSTFVTRPFDLSTPSTHPLDLAAPRAWLSDRNGSFPALFEATRSTAANPLARAHRLSRSKVMGLRVLIDASCLGPHETGTQVHIISLIDALTARDDIADIGVSIPGHVPVYARRTFESTKVWPYIAPDGSFPDTSEADIVHRPFQPDRPLPSANWRSVASAVCITVQDLIAYRIGDYHSSAEQWLTYRRNFAEALGEADVLTTLSQDVVDALSQEALVRDLSAVHAAPCGTDHLRGDEAARTPAAFLHPDLAATPFIVCIGTNYAHKNRDLAVRAWQHLAERGHPHRLVLAGAAVPYGSSRIAEERARGLDTDGIVSLLDISSEERNWLLRHAAALIYPTSAEGFGLVPFEAARFGTPTVAVRFGPLEELNPTPPVSAESWDPAHFADAVERLIADPTLAARQVAHVLASGAPITWSAYAERLVHIYRLALASAQTR
jgi:glycosyltransferase involved in cell wall biosynthesis